MNGNLKDLLYFKLVLIVIGVAWLGFLSGLMITDVWDESEFLQILRSNRETSGLVDTIVSIWTFERPQITWRPLGTSFLFSSAILFNGDFIWLRNVNALLLLGSACFLARSLMLRYEVEASQAIAFFTIMLFSASSLITAGWFVNVFDALCLFFVALALYTYVSERLLVCGISFSLAVFCKESYVLAFPVFAWLLWEDMEEGDSTKQRPRIWLIVSVAAVSLVYWGSRQQIVPLGSEADIHGFDWSLYVSSSASFASGFVAQTFLFRPGIVIFWVGIAALLPAFWATRGLEPKLTAIAILVMSTIVYLGMFGFHVESLMDSHNFIGRLYLIPFTLCLFVLFASRPRPAVVLALALFSIWGMGQTYKRHVEFQSTFVEIYALADETEQTLTVHYPQKPMRDFTRGLHYGDFPDAEIRINVVEGGIDGC